MPAASRTLVAYFTRSGNTKVIASTVQRELKADLFEIRPAQPYPEDYEEIVAQAAEAGVADNVTVVDNGADDGDVADRGVSAATGNNSIAQGLIGLLLASILGAAAFVFGRRREV